MSVVYLMRGEAREAFIEKAFQQFDILKKARGKQVLIKPNIVSSEPYPTTTHPVVLETCLRLLLPVAGKIVVADGPAFDAGGSQSILENHPLKRVCGSLGVSLIDLLSKGAKVVKSQSLELEVSQLAFECDFILSLPVLKSHSICGLTGALKNHIGFLSRAEKKRLHWNRDVHRVIAELNLVIKPDFYIVDAVQTMINTNEVRHGGKPHKLGYMLAGTDPVSLDVAGLDLLKEIEPKLRGKRFDNIPHLRNAVDLGVGQPQYKIIECHA
ncbi:MAG: DUF362 domain-containing protein [Chloroflexi bacterium]|nr:DUF362 domain-containing protein [Chloroflexota bacterium]